MLYTCKLNTWVNWHRLSGQRSVRQAGRQADSQAAVGLEYSPAALQVVWILPRTKHPGYLPNLSHSLVRLAGQLLRTTRQNECTELEPNGARMQHQMLSAPVVSRGEKSSTGLRGQQRSNIEITLSAGRWWLIHMNSSHTNVVWAATLLPHQ